MELICKKRLYEKIARLEMEAKSKLAKTPRDSEEYIRYETQFNERSAFKHMVVDERGVDVAQKLASYQSAEEQGLLLRLPCRIGAKLYDITEFVDGDSSPEIYLINADNIEIYKDEEGLIYCIDSVEYREKDFGKIVFLTRAEAEKALVEMGKSKV